MRGQLPATPILFLTHRDSEHDVVQALEAGADDFLVKPLREREYEVALFFFCNLGSVRSLATLWKVSEGEGVNVTTRTVDTHVSRLRSSRGLSTEIRVRLTPGYGYG